MSALIEKVTGEQVSHTTIWKLRNGQATNPQLRVIEALARTFGVPPSFFFEDYDEQQAGLLQEQVEMLAVEQSIAADGPMVAATAPRRGSGMTGRRGSCGPHSSA